MQVETMSLAGRGFAAPPSLLAALLASGVGTECCKIATVCFEYMLPTRVKTLCSRHHVVAAPRNASEIDASNKQYVLDSPGIARPRKKGPPRILVAYNVFARAGYDTTNAAPATGPANGR